MIGGGKPGIAAGWSIAGITGTRGSGFGNEAISWAKAFIGAQELGLRTVHPAWGLNPRQYWRDFETSRLDWLAHRAAAPLAIDISWADIISTGLTDYGLALRALQPQLPRRPGPLVVRHVSGMAGGFLAVRRARHHLLTEVLRPTHVSGDLYRIAERWPPGDPVVVAVHVRAGDFTARDQGPGPGQFNQRIPIDWYVRTCQSIRSRLQDRVVFLVLTDEPRGAATRRLVTEVGAVLPPRRQLPLLSDLAAMAVSDLVVCSVSSMSMLGVFLSGRPYLWYGPHLEETDGWLSIWGQQQDQLDGPTARNRDVAAAGFAGPFRGTAVGRNGLVPDDVLENLVRTKQFQDVTRDLVMYGVIPPPSS